MEEEKPASLRLRALAEMAGYESVADFARAVHIKEVTARQQLNRDSITKEAAAKYVQRATRRGVIVGVDWLLYGTGRAPVKSDGATKAGVRDLPEAERDDAPPQGMVIVAEHDVRAPSGPNGSLVEINGGDETDQTVARHGFPSEGFRQVYGSAPDQVRIISVVGDSMAPTLFAGQRVMIDTADRTPSPPGVFVLWDGDGLVLKRVERVFGSKDPAKLAIMSDNPKYRTYEVPIEEVHINGRVIGVWARM